MKNRVLITLLIVGIAVAAQAQVMPSPDASSMIKGQNVPVNLYTGVASVDVPLFSAQGVPVSLQYNTGGIKVSEIAGVAGLGWHLNAGGSITRVMQGEPDEQATFTTTPTYVNVVEQYRSGSKSYDREKDLFYFSYPGGGGRFIFSGNFVPWKSSQGSGTLEYSAIEVLPSSDIDVKYYYTSDLNSHWVITDVDGTRYTFGQTSGAREVTKANSRKLPETYDSNEEREFVSTWQLNRIEYANMPTSKDVTFAYTLATLTDEQESGRTKLLPGSGNTYVTDEEEKTKSRTIITSRYLSSINFPKGSVSFLYGDRDDLANGKRLSSVVVKDHLQNEVSNYTLDQSYFDAADSYYAGGQSNCAGEKCLRLKLNSVSHNGMLLRSFNYANDKDFYGAAYGNADKFELPPRDSYYYDHWGYYNGSDLQGTTYVTHAKNGSPALSGMDREPNEYSQANILIRSTYPSGGYTDFTYSEHPQHGGVRIHRVESFESPGNRVSGTEYVYLNADENTPIEPIYISEAPDGNDAAVASWTHTHAKSLIFELNGLTTGYSKVKVLDLNTSAYSVHYFVTETELSLTPSTKFMYSVDMASSQQNGWINPSYVQHSDHIAPFASHHLDFYSRGAESKVETFDEASLKVREVVNNYQHVDKPHLNFINHTFYLHTYDEENGELQYNYVVSEYMIRAKYLRMQNSIARSYNDFGILNAETTTTYSYHDTYKTLPKSVVSGRTDGLGGEAFNTKSLTYYPSDKADLEFVYLPSLLDDMVTANMVAIPVQTITQIDGPNDSEFKTTGASVTTFREQHNLIQPYESRTLNLSQPTNSYGVANFRLVSTQSFNANGELVSQVGTDGISTSNTYDAQGYLTSTSIAPGGGLASRATTFTYKPLVGSLTTTDHNGRTVTNVYDSQNRLHLVKDQDGNIVKRYRYNLAGTDSPILAGGIKISGSNLNGSTLTFEADFDSYGGHEMNEYHWDLDGTLYDNDEVSVSQSFSTGMRNIELSVVNPEYAEPAVINTSIFIHDAYWSVGLIEGNGEICGNGGILSGEGPVGGGSLTPEFYSITLGVGGSLCAQDGPYSTEWKYLSGINWVTFATDVNSVELPESLRLTNGSKQIKVEVTDACGTVKTSSTKFINVITCDPGGGGGGTGPTWSINVSTNDPNMCLLGEPSSVSFSANLNEGNHTCGSPTYSNYTWELLRPNTSTWVSLLGTGNSIIVTRSVLQGVNSSLTGTFSIRATVADGCGATESSTGSTSITCLDSSAGGGGIN